MYMVLLAPVVASICRRKQLPDDTYVGTFKRKYKMASASKQREPDACSVQYLSSGEWVQTPTITRFISFEDKTIQQGNLYGEVNLLFFKGTYSLHTAFVPAKLFGVLLGIVSFYNLKQYPSCSAKLFQVL